PFVLGYGKQVSGNIAPLEPVFLDVLPTGHKSLLKNILGLIFIPTVPQHMGPYLGKDLQIDRTHGLVIVSFKTIDQSVGRLLSLPHTLFEKIGNLMISCPLLQILGAKGPFFPWGPIIGTVEIPQCPVIRPLPNNPSCGPVPPRPRPGCRS